MKAEIKKRLMEIAAKLPVEWTKVGYEDHDISHEDLKLLNQEFDENIRYTIKVPVMHKVNHFERLKKEFQRKGIKGVKNYLR